MKINQIYQIVNQMAQETLGDVVVTQEDLGNIADVGRAFNQLGAADYERFLGSLIDHIGRVVFVNRPYSGAMPSLMRDSWEFGSILEKIQAEVPIAESNPSWSLTDQQVYEQDKFTKANVSAKVYNALNTFEIPLSIAERQAKSAFDNVGQLNQFFSMLETAVYNGITIRTDAESMGLIRQAIAATLANAFPEGGYSEGTHVRAVNLLYLYNQQQPQDEQIEDLAHALTDGRFIRFAAYTMSMYQVRMSKMSKLFNIEGKARFTPADRLHFITLADFAKAADVYNMSDTYHDQFVALPKSDVVPYWQGSGTAYDLTSVSSINVTTATATGSGGVDVVANGILGVMFDHDALAVCNDNERTTTHYNARAEFINTWHKVDNHLLYDSQENCVVFYAA
jgi:hypothetical protein